MNNHARPELKHKLNPFEKLGNQDETAPTICENHRRLWRLVDKNITDTELASRMKAMIEVGYDMGKRMDDQLRKYRDGKIPK